MILQEIQQSEKRFRIKRWLCVTIGLICVGMAVFYWAGSPRKTSGDGLSAHLGVFMSNGQSGAATTSTAPPYACIDFHSVGIQCVSGHPLEIACAKQIAEQLKAIPEIETISFMGNEPFLGKDEPLPAYVVRVHLADCNEWVLPNRSIATQWNISFGYRGVMPWATFADSNLPMVTLNHSSHPTLNASLTGISTQTYFYERLGAEIAKQFVKTLRQQLDKLIREHPRMPAFPEIFYPNYVEASKIPPLPDVVSRKIILDGRRFMQPHESLELLEIKTDISQDDYLTEVQNKMNAEGWEGQVWGSTGSGHQGPHNDAHLHMTHGEESFYLFSEADEKFSLTFNLSSDEGKDSSPKPQASHISLYMERKTNMSREQQLAAISQLLDEDAPVESVLMFSSFVKDKNDPEKSNLANRMREKFLPSQSSSPAGQLELVRFFNELDDKEIAAEKLGQAWRIRKLTLNPETDATYEKLAEKLDMLEEMKELPPPDESLCKECGFILLRAEDCPMEMSFDPGKEYRLVAFGNSGDVGLFTFRFRKEGGRFSSENFTAKFSSTGVSSSSSVVGTEGYSTITINGHIQLGEQDGLFEIKPAAEAKQPQDGRVTLQITYKDAAGNV